MTPSTTTSMSTSSTSVVTYDPDAAFAPEIQEEYWDEEDSRVGGDQGGLAEFAFRIGEAGKDGADLYEGVVLTPLELEQDIEYWGGFLWGRHRIVVEAPIGQDARREVFEFARTYVRETVGSRKDCEVRLAQLGQWEAEDQDVRFRDTPNPPRIEARLLSLTSPDLDLAGFAPPPGEDFHLCVHARIGAGGIGDEVAYEFILCTPRRLRQLRDLNQVSLLDGFAFMNRFDLAMLEREVAKTCAELLGYAAAEAIAKFGRYASRLLPSGGIERK